MKYLQLILVFIGFICLSFLSSDIQAQEKTPATPVELLFGNNQLYFQLVVKRDFSPGSRFSYFTVATYSADYKNPDNFDIIIPVQFSYSLGRGFGVMAGTDINSTVGFSPIVGPQYTYVSKTFLAVTVASVFLNEESDFKIFGLYEYTPSLNDKWSLYSRLQFIYNHSWKLGTHNHSYLYLRGGVQRGPVIFGVGANLEQSGPFKSYQENYGLFVRFEFL